MSVSTRALWSRLKAYPTPVGALALGIASLGLVAESQIPAGGLIQGGTAAIAAVLQLLLALRFLRHPDSLWEDLRHPVLGPVAPTFAMGVMIVSNALAQLSLPAGLALWCLAIAIHLLFLVTFLRHRLAEPRLHFFVPSWFVPPVGIAVAAASYAGPHDGLFYAIALACMWFALLGYAILLPLMFYRLIFEDTIPDAAKPTIAILAAPASLCLAAYLSIAPDPTALVIMLLYGIAVLMTATVYLAFFRLLALPFSPGYAGFTFPMAIGATAQFKVADQIESWGVRPEIVAEVRLVGWVELGLATLVISYVALRFALHYWRRSAPNPEI